ncbi:hypothetical protein [Nostoc sp. TCL26-01]|uniref:hypothetical protein n=1 Tax=Nostoc sp. TCL26-01 TaxID=2576904 RepID=UPI0015BFF800|nr:hypothetical protein [Nostoc sp. TCL26-01]QLE56448.1 hypothetical protein FD725_13550 [Nostoc sp. TCL26-01]
MFSKYLKSSFVALVVMSALFSQSIAIAQTTIDEDKLDTVNGMPWGGDGLPFDKVAGIKDALVNSSLGKVVIDRHGEDPLGTLFQQPFNGPSPGRFVIVSFWGSKIEGCFVKMVVQKAPTNGEAEIAEIAPKLIELGIGEQILQLNRSPKAQVRGLKGQYTYTEYANNTKYQRSSTWYMTDTLFDITAEAANLLRNAPAKEVKARLTFDNGDTKIIPIGSGNVKRWQEAFGFNNSCRAPQ